MQKLQVHWSLWDQLLIWILVKVTYHEKAKALQWAIRKPVGLWHSRKHDLHIDVVDCTIIWITEGANNCSDLNFITMHLSSCGKSKAASCKVRPHIHLLNYAEMLSLNYIYRTNQCLATGKVYSYIKDSCLWWRQHDDWNSTGRLINCVKNAVNKIDLISGKINNGLGIRM